MQDQPAAIERPITEEWPSVPIVLSQTPELPIGSIIIGERRREDYGDIKSLAASIEQWGLLHPVVVDESNRLVAGGRRLEACRSLMWTSIPIRRLGDLTEAELREIELAENLQRKDLTQYERNKVILRLVETAREIAAEEEISEPEGKETRATVTQVNRGSRGPVQTPGSLRDVSARIGIPEPTIRRSEQHVETAEAYPFMQKPDWKQYQVLEARDHLEHMPEPVREAVGVMIGEDGIPPKLANELLTNIRQMPEPEQQEIARLYQSPDERDRNLAKSKARHLPPGPDPQILNVKAALRYFDDGVKELAKCIQQFPADPWTPRIQEIIADVKTIEGDIRKATRA